MRLGAMLLVLFAIGCGDDGAAGDDAPGGGGGGEPPELAGIVAAHNDVRGDVQTSPPLVDLAWDDSLAATARAWVAMCRDQDAPSGLIDHNPNRGAGHADSVGENVYGSSGGASGTDAVTAWASERTDYDYATNTCNGVCGHYTQIVLRSTTRIGCAIGACPSLRFGSSVVCNYSPAGNVGGQKPY